VNWQGRISTQHGNNGGAPWQQKILGTSLSWYHGIYGSRGTPSYLRIDKSIGTFSIL